MSKNCRYDNESVNSKHLRDKKFLNRIKKSLYHGKFPQNDCLSLPVTELAADFFTEINSDNTLEKLDVEEACRISKYTRISSCTLVLALLYIERLKDCNPKYLQQVTPSKLFLVSLMVASKFLHDDGEDDEVITAEWAISGKITLSNLIKLEKDFLHAIDWTIFVRQQDFWERLQRLEKDVAYQEMQKRGWCSYAELICLMDSAHFMMIARVVIHVSYICLATYLAGLIALLGSTFVAQSIGTISTSSTPVGSEFTKQCTSLRPNFILNRNATLLKATQSHVVGGELLIAADLLINNNTARYPVMKSDDINGIDNENNNGSKVSWQWWLNSKMTWLPKYCGLNSGFIDQVTESFTSFITDAECSLNVTEAEIRKTTQVPVTEDYCRYNVIWKKVLNLIANQLSYWKRLNDFLKVRFKITVRPPTVLIC